MLDIKWSPPREILVEIHSKTYRVGFSRLSSISLLVPLPIPINRSLCFFPVCFSKTFPFNMAFAGQAPTIIVLKEGLYRIHSELIS